jgi:hypothetical protein
MAGLAGLRAGVGWGVAIRHAERTPSLLFCTERTVTRDRTHQASSPRRSPADYWSNRSAMTFFWGGAPTHCILRTRHVSISLLELAISLEPFVADVLCPGSVRDTCAVVSGYTLLLNVDVSLYGVASHAVGTVRRKERDAGARLTRPDLAGASGTDRLGPIRGEGDPHVHRGVPVVTMDRSCREGGR